MELLGRQVVPLYNSCATGTGGGFRLTKCTLRKE